MFVLLILGLLGIVFFEAPRLIYKRYWKELAVFLLLWVLASLIAVSEFLEIQLPNPLELAASLLKLIR